MRWALAVSVLLGVSACRTLPARSTADAARVAQRLCALAVVLPNAFEPVRAVCREASPEPERVEAEWHECLADYAEQQRAPARDGGS